MQNKGPKRLGVRGPKRSAFCGPKRTLYRKQHFWSIYCTDAICSQNCLSTCRRCQDRPSNGQATLDPRLGKKKKNKTPSQFRARQLCLPVYLVGRVWRFHVAGVGHGAPSMSVVCASRRAWRKIVAGARNLLICGLAGHFTERSGRLTQQARSMTVCITKRRGRLRATRDFNRNFK